MQKSSDKFAHLGIGGLVCTCITLVIIVRIGDLWRVAVSPLAGTVAVMMFEFFKEYVIDKEFSWKDVLYTFAGCFLVFVAVGIGLLFNQLSNSSY